MNIRCSFCQTPYTIGRVETLDALQHLYAKNLNHYDAHCPRCRRATPVLRQKLEMTMPNWREELERLEAEMIAHPQQEAPLPKPQPDLAPQAESKPSVASAQDGTAPAPASKPESKPEPEPVKEEPAPKPKAEAKADPAKTGTKTSSPKRKATAKSK